MLALMQAGRALDQDNRPLSHRFEWAAIRNSRRNRGAGLRSIVWSVWFGGVTAPCLDQGCYAS